MSYFHQLNVCRNCCCINDFELQVIKTEMKYVLVELHHKIFINSPLFTFSKLPKYGLSISAMLQIHFNTFKCFSTLQLLSSHLTILPLHDSTHHHQLPPHYITVALAACFHHYIRIIEPVWLSHHSAG